MKSSVSVWGSLKPSEERGYLFQLSWWVCLCVSTGRTNMCVRVRVMEIIIFLTLPTVLILTLPRKPTSLLTRHALNWLMPVPMDLIQRASRTGLNTGSGQYECVHAGAGCVLCPVTFGSPSPRNCSSARSIRRFQRESFCRAMPYPVVANTFPLPMVTSLQPSSFPAM